MPTMTNKIEYGPTMDDYTFPGKFAERLYSYHGSDCPIEPVECWAVINDEVLRVTIRQLCSANGHGVSVDYANTVDGQHVPTFYLWPVKKHCKPELKTLWDDYGTYRQWVSKHKGKTPW